MRERCHRVLFGFVTLVALLGLTAAERQPADPSGLVDERVQAWRIKPEDRPFDQIGWAADIRDALKLAKESNRPVFLFTLDGRMNIGRC